MRLSWDILAGPSLITWALKSEKISYLWPEDRTIEKWSQRRNFVGFKDGEGGPQATECEWSLEGTMGKEMDSLLEPLERPRPCQRCDFSQRDLGLTSNFKR